MKILVQKFGGTSVSDNEKRLQVARKAIQAKEDGFSPVIVVSAMGRKGAPYATDTLLRELKEIDPNSEAEKREKDLLMCCGEIISTVIMAHTLKSLGYPAVALTGGQAGIITDYEFGNARILSIDPSYILQVLSEGKIAVVAGFQGVTAGTRPGSIGAFTTLGRGGSDTTASALGAALKATAVEIYTDVNGVMTADPNVVKNAQTLDTITYELVAEMAHQGAKVLHPRAAEIAMEHGIPLWVKSTFEDARGTLITNGKNFPQPDEVTVIGVTQFPRVAWVSLTVQHAEDKPRIGLEIYKLLAQAKVNIYFVSITSKRISFVVQNDLLWKVQEMLNGLIIPIGMNTEQKPPCGRLYLLNLGGKTGMVDAQRRLVERTSPLMEVHEVPAQIVENCCIVSVIATSFRHRPGMMCTVAETLAEAKVPILQTADSDYSVSCLIHDTDMAIAVRSLHDRFGLGG